MVVTIGKVIGVVVVNWLDRLHLGTIQQNFINSITSSTDLNKLIAVGTFNADHELKLTSAKKDLANLNSTLLNAQISSLTGQYKG